jgi:hypothetical protein
MHPPNTTAELLVSQFAPAVLLTLRQVSQVTGQAEQTIRNLISQNRTTLPTRKVRRRQRTDRRPPALTLHPHREVRDTPSQGDLGVRSSYPRRTRGYRAPHIGDPSGPGHRTHL